MDLEPKTGLKNQFSALFPFLISGFFHLLLFLGLVSYLSFSSPSLQKKHWVEVALEASVPVQRSRSVAPVASKKQKSKSSSLSYLGVPIAGLGGMPLPTAKLSGTTENPDRSAGESKSEEKGAVEGEESDLFTGTHFGAGDALKVLQEKNTALYRFLYNKIDANLTYPSEFVKAEIQGSVAARIFFDEQGNYDPAKSQLHASDSYLRVQAGRVLRRALADPIPDSVQHKRGAFSMDCLFRFEITQNADQKLIENQKFTAGKKLFFYRSVYVSKLEWKVGPLSGLGPFSAGIDPSWLFAKGLGLFSQKAEIDPLQKYRDDPLW